ncbi:MAG: hypothetical protein M0Z89_08405 [Nitrospiraceae bacterium]|nr:hypothetical protein [Nitrospiraceae bacterium]
MKNKSLLVVLFLIALLGAAVFPAQAEEELFDTKAAAQRIEKGIADIQAKNFDAAITEFEAAAEINPDAEAYYYLGYAYYLKGRTGDKESRIKSRENFKNAYEIDPNFTPTRLKPTEPAPVPQSEQSEPAATAESRLTPTTAPAPDDQQPAQPEPAPPAEEQQKE